MSHLIFDTETSGFPDKKIPLDHPNQARVLSIAAILLDDNFQEVSSFYSLIEVSDSIIIHPGASAANGITKEQCQRYGAPIQLALGVLSYMKMQADFQVGHNIQFDNAMITNEIILLGDSSLTNCEKNAYCTMQATTDICRLPGKYGKFKWPKLQEAYTHIFNKPFSNAHNALADVRACAEIWQWLIKNQHVILPKVV